MKARWGLVLKQGLKHFRPLNTHTGGWAHLQPSALYQQLIRPLLVILLYDCTLNAGDAHHNHLIRECAGAFRHPKEYCEGPGNIPTHTQWWHPGTKLASHCVAQAEGRKGDVHALQGQPFREGEGLKGSLLCARLRAEAARAQRRHQSRPKSSPVQLTCK